MLAGTSPAVGRYFTGAKQTGRAVTVACHASPERLAGTGATFAAWIADECHKTESDQVKTFAHITEIPRIIGFTATPYRAELRESLSLFDSLAYEYTGRDAVKDGVCVRPNVIIPEGAGDQAGPAELDAVCIELCARAAAHGPGVVSAYNVKDADEFAEALTNQGVEARPIHYRQSKKRQRELIDALEAGEIACLVHVSLLAEGVDFPWLRWMCLRRGVSSRVRFLQETGRVLRAFPGKAEGFIYDPHDLYGSFALTYDAMLGEPEEPPDHEEKICDHELMPCAEEENGCHRMICIECPDGFRQEGMPVAGIYIPPDAYCYKHAPPDERETAERKIKLIRNAERWLRQTSLALYYLGAVDQQNKRWTTAKDTASAPQIRLVTRLAPKLRGIVSGDVAERLRECYRIRDSLTKRGASDLIDAMSLTIESGTWPLEN